MSKADAGQTTHSDRYFNLSGVTYSTLLNLAGAQAAVNYYRTEYGYDERGRPSRLLTPSYQRLNLTDPTDVETVPGTIYRTVYDGLGRMVSSWVGTSDTSDWSPGNPGDLVQTHAYEYDHHQPLQIGDSNLTRMTQLPGGGAASRVTEHSYDWRNRRVASKAGVDGGTGDTVQRPLSYVVYDNLSQVTAEERYDGDSISGLVDAVPPAGTASPPRRR